MSGLKYIFSISPGVSSMAKQAGTVTNSWCEPERSALSPVAGLQLEARYNAGRTGGDFYDAVVVGSRVAFLLSDIAGRRAETHPIAAIAQKTFRATARDLFGPENANLMDATALLVQAINAALFRAAGGIRFAPTFVGCYDAPLGLIAYINAGGQTAILRDSDGTRMLPNVAMPMGLFTHLTYEPSIMAFEPGARLVVVTKGVTEQRRGRRTFGPEGVRHLVEQTTSQSATDICDQTLKAATDFARPPWYRRGPLARKHSPRLDDLTVLVATRPLPA